MFFIFLFGGEYTNVEALAWSEDFPEKLCESLVGVVVSSAGLKISTLGLTYATLRSQLAFLYKQFKNEYFVSKFASLK